MFFVRAPLYNGKLPIALLSIAAALNVAGYIHLFDRIWWYDKALHAFTSFAIALALAFALRATLVARLRAYPLLATFTIAAFTIVLGVLWEIAEWLVDIDVYPAIIRGKTDTMLDLIFDGAGALLGGWCGVRALTRRQTLF